MRACTCPRDGSYYCAWCQSLAVKAGVSLATLRPLKRVSGEPQIAQEATEAQTLVAGHGNTEGRLGDSERFLRLLPPGAAIGTSLPLRLTNTKSHHEHWSTQSKRTRLQRHYVFEHLMALWEDGPLLGLPLTITITRVAPRALDSDNCLFAASPIRDATADWLCGQYLKGQDRQDGLTWVYEQKRLAPAFYAVEIKVERPKKRKPYGYEQS